MELFSEALAAYHSLLGVYTRETSPPDWAMTQNDIGFALFEQAKRSDRKQRANLLGQAALALRSALEVYTDAEFPYRHHMTEDNLNRVTDLLERSNAKKKDRTVVGSHP